VATPRFRFGAFLVSPAHRTLRRDGGEVPLIPRYFDLLVLLLTERHRVVERQEIFDRVWADVVVSDGALSQAIRTIRRSLGDDPRAPLFIRTVSRHGYQFVSRDVCEERDDGPFDVAQGEPFGVAQGQPFGLAQDVAQPRPADADRLRAEQTVEAASSPPADPREALIARLLNTKERDEERREAAEQLHMLGTADALARLDGLPGHAEARALLRDARWDVPGAGPVPLLSSPDPFAAILHLVRLRYRRAARHMSNRWGTAALGGTTAGILAGLAGGVSLWLVPESGAEAGVIVALAVVGGVAGALGAAGVGAGLASAEVLARSARATGLTICGAIGGALSGALAHVVARAVLAGVFGRDVPAIGGWLEGLVLGAAAGLGYARATSLLPGGGLAGPRGAARTRAALTTGLACGIAAILLSLAGGNFVGSSLDAMAAAFEGSDVGLAPLARLLGEEELRPVTRTLISGAEATLFGIGLAFGLTHRPRTRL
jgi:DNA-binding winged helix-turn-helix (wHTH) protein